MNFSDGPFPVGNDDRARLQDRITAIESRVRRRIRGKFRAIARGPFDLDDVMASTRQSLDQAVVQRTVIPSTEQPFCAYVCCIAERVVRDVARHERRQRSLWIRQVHSGAARRRALDSFPARRNEAAANVQEILALLDPKDRGMLELIARGLSPTQVAAATGVSIAAQHSRWRRIVARIQHWLGFRSDEGSPSARSARQNHQRRDGLKQFQRPRSGCRDSRRSTDPLKVAWARAATIRPR